MPTEEAPVSDQSRILLALGALGYEHATIPLHILRTIYSMCRDANFDITVTLVHREHDWVVSHVEPGDQRHHHYGLAVDYGSTTILMQLVDLNAGTVIAEEKVVNGQVAYGMDILTRITYCLEHEEHPANLQRTTVETFHFLLAQLTESTSIDTSKCSVMVVSGNTTMVHFLLGLNAWTVFAAPFAPVTADPGYLWGHELGMDFEGLLHFTPTASNYVGGDIVSGLLAQMRLNGWINIAGELNPASSPRIVYLPDENQYGAVYAHAEESATGSPLYFSQTDIDQYLDTKAAAFTMMECLLESAGIAFEDLYHCYLSGAFPAHSDLESAITIGICPDLLREKYRVLRNSSLDGARKVLLDHSHLTEAKELLENIYCVQFASIPDFLVRMQAAKFIPHTDMNRFPSVQQKLSNPDCGMDKL